MRVELLVLPECPNEAPARELLGRAAQLAGITDLQVTTTMIDSDDEAQRRGFIGSPTFLVEGSDPFAVPGAPAGLACRLYPTTTGPSGTPDLDSLRAALVRARAGPAGEAATRDAALQHHPRAEPGL